MPPGDENNPKGKIKHWKAKETPKGLGQRSFGVLLRPITQACVWYEFMLSSWECDEKIYD